MGLEWDQISDFRLFDFCLAANSNIICSLVCFGFTFVGTEHKSKKHKTGKEHICIYIYLYSICHSLSLLFFFFFLTNRWLVCECVTVCLRVFVWVFEVFVVCCVWGCIYSMTSRTHNITEMLQNTAACAKWSFVCTKNSNQNLKFQLERLGKIAFNICQEKKK